MLARISLGVSILPPLLFLFSLLEISHTFITKNNSNNITGKKSSEELGIWLLRLSRGLLTSAAEGHNARGVYLSLAAQREDFWSNCVGFALFTQQSLKALKTGVGVTY